MSKKKNKEIALAREFMDVMSVFLERTYSIYETTTKEAFTSHENVQKLKSIIDQKKIRKEKIFLSSLEDMELLEAYRKRHKSFLNADISSSAQFVYLHSIFEKELMKLIETSVKNNPKVKQQYKHFFIKKNEELIREKKKPIFTSETDTNSHKDLLAHIDTMLEGKGHIWLLKRICEISDNQTDKRFKFICSWYYESKKRRNLLNHRKNVFDKKYFNEIAQKSINLKKEDIEGIFSHKKIVIGETPADPNIFYFHWIHHIMVMIYAKFLPFAIVDKNDTEDDIIAMMYECLQDWSRLRKYNFPKQFSLYATEIIYENYKADHDISPEKWLYYNCNLGIAKKEIVTLTKDEKKKKDFADWLLSNKEKFEKEDLGKCVYLILSNKYDAALDVLSKLKNEEVFKEVTDPFYHWPIFEYVRKNKKFHEIFKKFYNKEFKEKKVNL